METRYELVAIAAPLHQLAMLSQAADLLLEVHAAVLTREGFETETIGTSLVVKHSGVVVAACHHGKFSASKCGGIHFYRPCEDITLLYTTVTEPISALDLQQDGSWISEHSQCRTHNFGSWDAEELGRVMERSRRTAICLLKEAHTSTGLDEGLDAIRAKAFANLDRIPETDHV